MIFIEQVNQACGKIFFWGVIALAFLMLLNDAVESYDAQEWWGVGMNAGLALAVAQAYLTNWRKKI